MKPADPDELRRILELWADGLASVDIARELGMTKNAVLGRIWRYRRRGLADAPAMRIKPKRTTPKPKRIRLRAKRTTPASSPRGFGFDYLRARKNAPKPAKAVATPVAKKPAIDWAARLVEPIPADSIRFDKRSMGYECAWIYTDTSKPPAMCCGHATRPGSQYCPDHYARTWMAPKPRALPVHPQRRAA